MWLAHRIFVMETGKVWEQINRLVESQTKLTEAILSSQSPRWFRSPSRQQRGRITKGNAPVRTCYDLHYKGVCVKTNCRFAHKPFLAKQALPQDGNCDMAISHSQSNLDRASCSSASLAVNIAGSSAKDTSSAASSSSTFTSSYSESLLDPRSKVSQRYLSSPTWLQKPSHVSSLRCVGSDPTNSKGDVDKHATSSHSTVDHRDQNHNSPSSAPICANSQTC